MRAKGQKFWWTFYTREGHEISSPFKPTKKMIKDENGLINTLRKEVLRNKKK